MGYNNCFTVPCDPCLNPPSCPLQLDASCVSYHLYNMDKTRLKTLGLSNKSTLELILETIDDKIGVLGVDVSDFDLECLRQNFVINSVKDFLEAADEKACEVEEELETYQDGASGYTGVYTPDDPGLDTNDGVTWFNSDLSELRGNFQGAKHIIEITPV